MGGRNEEKNEISLVNLSSEIDVLVRSQRPMIAMISGKVEKSPEISRKFVNFSNIIITLLVFHGWQIEIT